MMGQGKTVIFTAIRMIDQFGATRGMIQFAALRTCLKNDLGLGYDAMCG